MALLSCGLAQHDYHYPRPQIPFHLTPQRPVREPPTRFIVQTLGPHGRTYELQTHKAPAIYVAHETVRVPQQQHHQQHHQQQQQQQQQVQYKQQYQQQYRQQQHHVQQPLQQLHTSAFQNPLLVNTNYQQTSASLTAPLPPPPPPPTPAGPAPPINYSSFGQSQAQGLAQQSVDSYYNAPQALTVATATHAQPAAHYGQPQVQFQLPHGQAQQQGHGQLELEQPHYSNPQPYAIVTLPNGQRVQDAGHGSGPLPLSTAGGSGQAPRIGDYSAQSQSATLDTYNYKQSVPGDARSYQRFVTNCQANGHCQQLTLNPGQIDGDHQQLLHAARSQTQPAASGCKKSNSYVPPGAEPNAQGELRPRGRRTYAHVQEQLVKYPYN
ncbi:hypothetical protein KR093_005361 [Drosophila rubida]|uniref:Uncharacterized protein n=1 Tax=Drosophila rubida TaxID=30044 RepID=A0AAD4K784_9MUSC|nr:hypothetical protein KR093_005361 [Drosophila rubida]